MPGIEIIYTSDYTILPFVCGCVDQAKAIYVIKVRYFQNTMRYIHIRGC